MSKPYVIGMDMGGTNTVFGIVDARGQVIASDSVKTKKHAKFEDYIADLHQAVTRLLEANDAVDKIKGIGIGAPNGNYYTGEIVKAPNLPWGPVVPLAETVSKAFNGIPVAVTNDANAAALGEMTYGAARVAVVALVVLKLIAPQRESRALHANFLKCGQSRRCSVTLISRKSLRKMSMMPLLQATRSLKISLSLQVRFLVKQWQI